MFSEKNIDRIWMTDGLISSHQKINSNQISNDKILLRLLFYFCVPLLIIDMFPPNKKSSNLGLS